MTLKLRVLMNKEMKDRNDTSKENEKSSKKKRCDIWNAAYKLDTHTQRGEWNAICDSCEMAYKNKFENGNAQKCSQSNHTKNVNITHSLTDKVSVKYHSDDK